MSAGKVRLTKVITGRIQLAHCRLFRPHTPFGQNPRYSAVILIPKDDILTVRAIREAQRLALKNGEEKFGIPVPADWTDTLRDGDFDPARFQNPGYAGHWFLSVSSPVPPGVIDASRPVHDGWRVVRDGSEPVYDESAVTDGCFARVSMNAFPFRTKDGLGVSFALNHVQKLGDPPAAAA